MIDLSELIKTEKLENVEEYMSELKRYRTNFSDETNFKEFLFEYGCQMSEHINIKPNKQSGYLKHIMRERLHDFYLVAQHLYHQYPRRGIKIPKINLDLIPELVKNEYNVGEVSVTELIRRNRESNEDGS